MALNPQQARSFRGALYAAYCAAALLTAYGIYQGWLIRLDRAVRETLIVAIVVLGVTTQQGERGGLFARRADWREWLKLAACASAAGLWMHVLRPIVSDTDVGTTIYIAPACALLWVVLYYGARSSTFSRPVDGGQGGAMGWLFTSKALPEIPAHSPPLENPPSLSLNGRTADVAAASRGMILRRLAGILIAGIAGIAMRAYLHSPWPIFGAGVFITAAILESFWVFTASGPALSFGSDGVTIRRGFGTARFLKWPEISSFELRSAGPNSFLVVHVRDASALMARQSRIARWYMRKSQLIFGSPVMIATNQLQCDRNWLLHTANGLLATHGRQV
jgi:hypothetical protein